MPKTSTPKVTDNLTEPANAPEWIIQQLLAYSRSIEVKSGKSGKQLIVHKN
jgi:hypothetical protein